MNRLSKRRWASQLGEARGELRRLLEPAIVKYFSEVNRILREIEEAFERREISGPEIAELMERHNRVMSLLAQALGWFHQAPNDTDENINEKDTKGKIRV